MRAAALVLGLLWLGGCDDHSDDPDEVPSRNGLQVRFVVDYDDDDIDHLVLRVGEVVLLADGPSGDVAVSHSTDEEMTLIGPGTGGAAATLDLETGDYDEAVIEAWLRELDGLPALEAEGVDEGIPWALAVGPDLLIETPERDFELGEGPDPEVRIVLDPDEWLDEIEVDELTRTDGVVLLDPDHNATAYQRIVQQILATTTSRFPGQSR